METTTNQEVMLTVQEAAEALGTTHLKVLMLIKQKALEAVDNQGDWLVPISAVECLKAHGTDIAATFACRTSCTSSGCHCGDR